MPLSHSVDIQRTTTAGLPRGNAGWSFADVLPYFCKLATREDLGWAVARLQRPAADPAVRRRRTR
jgi:hypothetical protein